MRKIESRITLISILVGLVGIAVTAYSWMRPQGNNAQNITIISSQRATAIASPSLSSSSPTMRDSTASNTKHADTTVGIPNLVISATGADVRIEQGDTNFPYAGGVISSTGAEQVVYLPKNQRLSVSLYGTGTRLSISKAIVKQVNVSNTGTGTVVSTF